MKYKGLMIFVFLVVFLAEESNAEVVVRDEIFVLNSAVVQGAAVYLSDIAVVKAAGQDKARLEKLEVARYEAQVIVSVGTFEICQALSGAQINPAGLDIFGASVCQVTFAGVSAVGTADILRPENQVAPGGGLGSAARLYTLADELTTLVGQMASLDAKRLKVDWYCSEKGFLEQAADSNRFKIIPRSSMSLGRVQFDVVDNFQAELNKAKQAIPGWRPGAVSVRGNVQYLCESVVALRSLAAGETITLDDVKILPQRVTSFRNVGLGDVNLVVGQEAARSISAHTIIQTEMIRKQQIIKRKQTVRVVSKVGIVQMSVRGEALGDGGLGDVIPVRLVNSKTIKQGTITGPGVVTVGDETGTAKANQTKDRDRGVSGYARKQ